MTETLADPTPPQDVDTAADAPAERRPSRLLLRRRLLVWSTPALVLLLGFAGQLGSVGILGDKLPGQFADRDRASMDSTLGWIDVGNFGRGAKELLAAGDAIMIDGDMVLAQEQFAAAFDKDPDLCPARGNFALTSERLSDRELAQGGFVRARELLEPAEKAANEDTGCFQTSTSPSPEARIYVGGTPERLRNKLTALRAGYLTETANGFDYIRTPGGGIDFGDTGTPPPCPFDDNAQALAECIRGKDSERAARIEEAERQEAADQAAQQPPPPGQPAPPPPPPTEATAPTVPKPVQTDQPVEFPDGLKRVSPELGFCKPDGTPLGDLGAALCTTSGPLP